MIDLKQLQKEFLIRYIDSSRKSKLITPKGLQKLIGIDLANKHFKRALESGLDKYTFCLRRGLKIDFYSI